MRHSLSEAGCGSSAPLPLGESGASSVKGGSERRAALLGYPLPRRGGAPANIGADLARSRFCPGSAYRTGRPIMGSKGPVVQARSTWFCEQPAVRCHEDRNGLDRSRRPAGSCAAVAGAALGLPYAAFVAAAGLPNSNSPPVTQMRCMITASLRATAMVARFTRPLARPRHRHRRGFVKEVAHHPIAPLADVPRAVDFARLIDARG